MGRVSQPSDVPSDPLAPPVALEIERTIRQPRLAVTGLAVTHHKHTDRHTVQTDAHICNERNLIYVNKKLYVLFCFQ